MALDATLAIDQLPDDPTLLKDMLLAYDARIVEQESRRAAEIQAAVEAKIQTAVDEAVQAAVEETVAKTTGFITRAR